MSTARILAVDDEPHVLELCRDVLEAEGYQVDVAAAAGDALERLRHGHYDLVLTDLKMPGRSGIDLLHDAREASVQVPFVILSGYPSIANAVDAVRQGAEDFLAKPFDTDQLGQVVRRVLDGRRVDREVSEHCALPTRQVSAVALEALRRYDGPGITGELRSTIERLVSLVATDVIDGRDIPAELRARGGVAPAPQPGSMGRDFRQAKRLAVDRFERDYLHDVLSAHDGNVTRSARESGMKRSAFQRLMRKHRLSSSAYREVAARGSRG